ncbi:hypothetical protein HBI56_089880 [Parastagonospora nodorum]|uniref:Uncharacterized protein n=1 Tax=Phaeosphaeria nodorum (strain SN15 / ATCC MYA-4574 / FGSC 10173) TaxID=321614 RepID=A0A7U2FHR2_PHANO|nr:hypothetical protein HBH56_109600 [Parastagonospora nodorum]QRD03280.1 hypothetical protein JI435_100580 [Parastagonospora nodorum SN15]KAH3922224.1 hypothetical protein HBH54_226710 [Parastagonospora nodorum]KAH3974465.1 hypothetical protein HBH51_092940 [Parastagonospora nodorum]KAH3979215.1 hypothetical protein HBH52_100910 [Parastagonospora nodorum]
MSNLDDTSIPQMTIPVSRPLPPGNRIFFKEPVKLTHIDQLLVRRDPSRISSFTGKHDRLHARIYDLLWNDPFTDMPNFSRRALASNIHFLVMKKIYAVVAAEQILADNIELIYQHDTLETCHRALLTIVPTSVKDENVEKADTTVSMTGNWVADQAQALEGLRQTVDLAIYGAI